MEKITYIAETDKKDIHKAIQILRGAGCDEIFLFGFPASREIGDKSDIDLAIRGCPRGKFFHLLGKLLMELDHISLYQNKLIIIKVMLDWVEVFNGQKDI
ncbi:MAG: hypothetical protein ACE5IR_18470 [bacterium]